MSFFALLGLVPLTIAFGAALRLLWGVADVATMVAARELVVDLLRVVLGADLTEDLAPFVRRLLSAQASGFALLSGLAASLLVGSRMFVPVIHGLDRAHHVDDRRSPLVQRLLGVALYVGSFVATGTMVAALVLGPLLGNARWLANQLSAGRLFELVWGVGRWPLLLVALVVFLASVYRFGPAATLSWRAVLPGTALATVLWLAVAGLFRVYLTVSGRADAPAGPQDEAVAFVAHGVGAVVATALWTFLLGAAILLGGELNGALLRRRHDETTGVTPLPAATDRVACALRPRSWRSCRAASSVSAALRPTRPRRLRGRRRAGAGARRGRRAPSPVQGVPRTRPPRPQPPRRAGSCPPTSSASPSASTGRTPRSSSRPRRGCSRRRD